MAEHSAALAELIARLEAATEGSAELDGRVICAVRGWRVISAEDFGIIGLVVRCTLRGREEDVGFTDKPTRSLDAAMAMVTGNWRIDWLQNLLDEDYWTAGIYCRNPDGHIKRLSGFGKTAPIALCVAALKIENSTHG